MTRLFPALAPVRTDIELVKSLKGLRVTADATLISGGRVIDRQSGEVQFTDGALSGICIFNLSAKAAEYINNGEISLDTAPTRAYKKHCRNKSVTAVRRASHGNIPQTCRTGNAEKSRYSFF